MPRPRTVADEQILSVARTHFLRLGPGASTRAIAEEVGISEAILFRRFGTKDGLFFAAMTLPEPDLDTIFDLVPGRGSVPRNVERAALRMLEYFRRASPVFVALVAHPSFEMREFLKGHHVPAVTLGGRLASYLDAECRLGRVRTGDHAAAAGVLISHVHNLALLDGLGGLAEAEATKGVAQAVRVMWDGLSP